MLSAFLLWAPLSIFTYHLFNHSYKAVISLRTPVVYHDPYPLGAKLRTIKSLKGLFNFRLKKTSFFLPLER